MTLPLQAQHYWGDNINDPIDAGVFGACGSRTFTDRQNNNPANGFGDDYGNPSDDIWYKFSVNNTNPVDISLCGSNFDTYLYLLDANGNEIASNDDNGPLCSTMQSSIQMSLAPGTYYIVAEGYGDNYGDLVLNISNSGDSQLPPGGTFATAINAGMITSSFTDTKNNTPWGCYQDFMGQPSPEIYYKFSVFTTSQINISTCGSNFDTYLHLLDANGIEIEYSDDFGPLCNGLQASIQTTLEPGTYYVVAEGAADFYGDIVLEISKTENAVLPPGANLQTAIDAGNLDLTFSDSRNNCSSNGYHNYIGQPSNEVYYKFTLPSIQEVNITHNGSDFDTYLHLLNESGAEIAFNDNNGPLFNGSQASIRMTLNPGTYYAVSEGAGTSCGNLITTIYKSPPISVAPLGANLSSNQNYIVTYTPAVSGITSENSLLSKNINELNGQVQYFDGLGRANQNVIIKGSPLLKDQVQPFEYDKMGREAKKYLPYASPFDDGRYSDASISDQATFYNSGSAKCATDARPFSETTFEPSPLYRQTKIFGQGQAWSPDHPVSYDYQTNGAGEVRIWTISGSTVSAPGYYNSGTLFKTQITDENNNKKWEYKDLQDRVILKTEESEQGDLKTYYVYDDYSRLAYVIPPKATGTSYTEGNGDFNELLYAYRYDGKGRMTEKHIPGAGWIYMVYNKIDKMILSQDENHRALNNWIFTKYDAFGRIIMTGKINLSGSRIDIQNIVSNESTLWESRDNTKTDKQCYSEDAYPRSNSGNGYEVLTANYYDSYGFGNAGYQQAIGNPATSSAMTEGLLTGSKVKVLDGGSTLLTSVTYYDDYGRPLQVQSSNILGKGDQISSKYDFLGRIIQSERKFDNLTLANRYTFDQAGRKKEVYQIMNGGTEVLLSRSEYNELGQLVKKDLHADPNNSAIRLQSIDYRYNIRGWLTGINNAELNNYGQDINDDAFGEELSYESGFTAGNTTGANQWNGNISGIKWKTKGPGVAPGDVAVSAYAFNYDKLNRMTKAGYGSGSLASSVWAEADFNNEEATYDPMGNILTLQRKSANTLIDNLSYLYGANSNKLLSVADISNNPSGFIDNHVGSNSYGYDGNGNMTQDQNKGISIVYNYLNLPNTVTGSGGTITYTYDASGRKLKKSFPGQADHYYFDGIEYENTSFLFATTEEGRVRQKPDYTFTYDYFLKDHLGNVRVVLSTDNSSQSMVYPAATMETATAATESTYYANLDKVRSFTPVGFKSLKKNEKVVHLRGTDPNRQIGPSITVKVQAGDTVNLSAQSFYPDNKGSERTGLAETALGQLVTSLLNPIGLNDRAHAMATERLKAQGFEKSTDYHGIMGGLPNSDYNQENDRPKAYMVWMLFDKEMKLVKTGRSSGARQIPEGAGQVKQMAETGIVMDQGGFLSAYTVNESPSSVYIDNFQLTTSSGGVIEENNYYPFGMINNGLSSEGTFDPVNNYKYNGKELQKELSLGWLDYGARFYDPVIGRWHSVDPLAENHQGLSVYDYCGGNPANRTDPIGMDWYQDEEGNVMWRRSQEKEYTDDDGKTWKNIGSNYLYVKGYNATLFQQKTKDNGELCLSSSSFEINKTANKSKSENAKEEVLSMQNSDWSREALKEYLNNPSSGNFFRYVIKEVLSQWTNPYLVTGGLSAGVAGLSSITESKLNYDPRVRARALQDPVSHNFPHSFDEKIVSQKPIITQSGYKIYQLEGTMNGKEGVFEIGMKPNGIIDHRFFKPNK